MEKLSLENVPIMGGDVYPAVVEVLCVYKGPRVDERITIAGFGKSSDCTTTVGVGDTYIIILMPFEDRYRVVEVNTQRVAVQRLPARYGSQIEGSYDCQEPFTLPPTTPIPPTSEIDTTLMTTWEMSTLVADSHASRSFPMYTSLLLVTFAMTQIIFKCLLLDIA